MREGVILAKVNERVPVVGHEHVSGDQKLSAGSHSHDNCCQHFEVRIGQVDPPPEAIVAYEKDSSRDEGAPKTRHDEIVAQGPVWPCGICLELWGHVGQGPFLALRNLFWKLWGHAAQGPLLALRNFSRNVVKGRRALKTSPALPRSLFRRSRE